MESNLEFGLISMSYLCGIICTNYIWMDRNSDHNVRFHRDTAATLFFSFFPHQSIDNNNNKFK